MDNNFIKCPDVDRGERVAPESQIEVEVIQTLVVQAETLEEAARLRAEMQITKGKSVLVRITRQGKEPVEERIHTIMLSAFTKDLSVYKNISPMLPGDDDRWERIHCPKGTIIEVLQEKKEE